MHKITSPFKAQFDGGLQLALLRGEALVAVTLHAEKLNVLPGLGPFLFLAWAEVAAQSGSGTFGMDRFDGSAQNQPWGAIEVL